VNKRKIALGPGAASLILIVVVLSLCMLAMLAQIGARNDYSLASRSAQMITRVYELHDQSERRMAELDAILVRCQKDAKDPEGYLTLVEENLPDDMTLTEDIVSWTEPLDNRTMNCEVQLSAPGEAPRAKWVTYKLKVDEPEEDWEW
jgi:hypothetical protein